MSGLALTQILATALLPNGIALTAVSDLLSVLMMLALALAFAGNAAKSPGRLNVFWLLQAASWSITLVNQGWWTYYDVVLKKPVPLFFSGDVLPFFPVVFMLAGFLLRPHFEQAGRSARRGTLDFLLLMVWWLYFYLYLVLTWQFVSPNEQLFNRNYAWLYFAANLVMVAVLIVLVLQSDGAWRRFYGLFLGAEFLKYGSFVLEDRAIDSNVYFSGSWYDCLYAAMFALFMVVA